jgi:catechol 2,3-dioxygenase-like lactoylglutathione lyase family enzyme
MILHHVAYVVDDLEQAIACWQRAASAVVELPPTTVGAHGVAVAFLLAGGQRIELVQAIGERSAVGRHERGRGHPDHVCFRCRDFDARVAGVPQAGGIVVRPPAESEAFGGKRTCFAFYRGVGLIEWVEE